MNGTLKKETEVAARSLGVGGPHNRARGDGGDVSRARCLLVEENCRRDITDSHFLDLHHDERNSGRSSQTCIDFGAWVNFTMFRQDRHPQPISQFSKVY